jgi:hypothetical protein
MNSALNTQLAGAKIEDWRRDAERFRSSHGAAGEPPDPYEAVTVRLARSGDADAVLRLSELDGRRAPSGSLLVAEVGGAVLAARSLENGASMADPFRPTAQLSELLELRANHLRHIANGRVHRRRRSVRAWLRALAINLPGRLGLYR